MPLRRALASQRRRARLSSYDTPEERADGAITCDTDGASDGVSTFSFCRGVDSAPRFCATVTCDVSATCFGFELKLKPKPGKPKPPKELKPKSLKADLRCVPPS